MSEAALSHAVQCEELEGEGLPPEEGQRAEFLRHLPEARAQPAKEVTPCRADTPLSYANALVVQTSMEGKQEELRRVPQVNADRLLEIASIALALVYAAARVRRTVAASEGTEEALARLRQIRMGMLRSLQGCAALGVVEEGPIERIAEGKGPLDAAQDAVDLSAFWRDHQAQLAGKTPITGALVQEAERLAAKVFQEVRPKGAPAEEAPLDLQEAIDDRDRLWTLLVARHKEAQRVAPLLFGEEAAKKVPSLQSRKGVRRKKAQPGEAQPA